MKDKTKYVLLQFELSYSKIEVIELESQEDKVYEEVEENYATNTSTDVILSRAEFLKLKHLINDLSKE